MKYNTFFFDFDGTVINSVEAIVLSMNDTFESFGLQAPSEKIIRSFIGVPIEKIPYLDSAEENGVSGDQIVSKYREIYKGSYGRTHIHIFEGMKEMLLDLKSKDAKLGIVSSKATEPLLMNLEDTDMDDIFDVIIGSDQVTQYKPLPETVFLCARQIGLEDARQALVIGDAYHDIEMGHRAGMDTCAVSWGAGTREELKGTNPTYYVDEVSELKTILLS